MLRSRYIDHNFVVWNATSMTSACGEMGKSTMHMHTFTEALHLMALRDTCKHTSAQMYKRYKTYISTQTCAVIKICTSHMHKPWCDWFSVVVKKYSDARATATPTAKDILEPLLRPRLPLVLPARD